ncbi:uncharacterized protein JCM6883_001763 [Sporobolomyces salmoneus]|uniref:uncharacterized protein n=1 Tax=Sporobolomyces salmoneus TaxID=183962 RepID=UPI00317E1B3F
MSAADGLDPEITGGEEEDPCGPSPVGKLGLRIGAIFIILATSLFATLFPVVTKRVAVLRRAVPGAVFEFAKFFGSGVILATGFIHLLEPAVDALGSTRDNGGCLSNAWGEYPYAFGISLTSLYMVFVIQIIAFRLGSARLAKIGMGQRHIHVSGHGGHVAEQDAPPATNGSPVSVSSIDREKALLNDSSSSLEVGYSDASEQNPLIAQVMGVATLEFGVCFHSVIIGLTLAVTGDSEFNVLFIVIIFHQMFEGLGLGSRLAFLQLPDGYGWVPFTGALAYSAMSPIGMAIGLGVREGLSMEAAGAAIASGVLDAISSGVLIYTATVELIAHEFIFNKAYHTCSWGRLTFSLTCFALGAGIMALLGKWA